MIYERRNLSFIQGCKDFFKGIINPFGRTTCKGFLCGLLMDFSVVIFICAVIISFVSTKVGSLIFFVSYYCLLTRRYLDLGFNLLGSIVFYVVLSFFRLGSWATIIQIFVGLLPTNVFEIKTLKFIKPRSLFFRKCAFIRKVLN